MTQGRRVERAVSYIERAVRWFVEMQATTLLLALVMWAVIEVLLPAILDVIDEVKEDAE